MSSDEAFLKAVEEVSLIIVREIEKMQNNILLEEEVLRLYESSENKQIIVAPRHYPWQALSKKPEPLFVVFPDEINDVWIAKAMCAESHAFASRKPFPESWAGKRDEELEVITGVTGAIFCHNKRFIVVAKTKDAILALAQMALKA